MRFPIGKPHHREYLLAMGKNRRGKAGGYTATNLDESLSSHELDELSTFLLSDATPETCMNLMKLDGYLTAIVIGPEVVMPSMWLPGVWGDKQGHMFETMEQAGQVTGLIIRHMNAIANVFLNQPLSFKPLFEADRNRNEDNAPEDWCSGFLHLMANQQDIWTQLMRSEAKVLLTPVVTLGFPEGQEKIQQSLDPVVEQKRWVELLVKTIPAIHGYWQEERRRRET